MLALIVEDDPVTCQVLCSILDSFNINSICCHNAIEGFDLLDRYEFDLIFLDNYLSNATLEGAQFWTFLFKHETENNVPIIGMSVDSFCRNMFKRQGAEFFIQKPIKPKDIKFVLDEIRKSRFRKSHDRES